MPARSIQPRVIYANIVRDFEAALNGNDASPRGDTGLGNFLFGFMGTLLLEWACRVCRQDASGSHLDRLRRGMTLIARATNNLASPWDLATGAGNTGYLPPVLRTRRSIN